MHGIPYTQAMTEALRRIQAQIRRRQQIDRLGDVLTAFAVGLLSIGIILVLTSVTRLLVGS